MLKTGIFVDAENVRGCGGYGMRYDKLYNYAKLNKGIVLRANTYLAEDTERMSSDKIYRMKIEKFHSSIRNSGSGFKIVKKTIKRFTDTEGVVTFKANADMELAIDALLQARNLDRIILVTGDGDFVRLIQALQNMGLRVEVIGFKNVNKELITTADSYFSGYVIPELLPFKDRDENGKRYRGQLLSLEAGYGFFGYYVYEGDNIVSKSIFFHQSDIEPQSAHPLLRNAVYEFSILENEKKEKYSNKAIRISCVS